MNTRRGLATLSLSIALHTLLFLALGGLLSTPKRIIPHIEVSLGPSAGSPQSTGEVPAPEPEPAPAPTHIPETPRPEPNPEPKIKPITRPTPRPVESKPVIKKIQPELTEPIATPAKQPRTKAATPAEVTSKTDGISNAGPSTTSHTAEESASGTGQKTDASALQAYLAEIRARIAAAKHYPMMAERRRIQGNVIVSFRLSFDGRLLGDPAITRSSGASLLDSAAVRAVKRAAPFPTFPGPEEEMLTEALSVKLDFVIR